MGREVGHKKVHHPKVGREKANKICKPQCSVHLTSMSPLISLFIVESWNRVATLTVHCLDLVAILICLL